VVAGAAVTFWVVSAAFAAALTWSLIGIARRNALLALPNSRSSHTVPTPTLGGIAIALPVFVWAIWRLGPEPLPLVVLASGGLLAVLGGIDDVHDLSPRLRLPIHCVAVALALWMLAPPDLSVATWRVAVCAFLSLLWSVNLYNFMDGIDGIAASQCVCFCAGVLLLGNPHGTTIELLWVLSGAAFGFLLFNWAPARIFMGDVASGLLGLLVGVLALELDLQQQMPLIASLLLLAGFWFDASYTLCVRIATGQPFVSAHRSHLYQKYARSVGHGRTTTMFIGFFIVWLMPLAWACIYAPRWQLLWLAAAIVPLLIACVVMRAGLPEREGARP
jgi:Fuc2NAc and GlcNAc transferase